MSYKNYCAFYFLSAWKCYIKVFLFKEKVQKLFWWLGKVLYRIYFPSQNQEVSKLGQHNALQKFGLGRSEAQFKHQARLHIYTLCLLCHPCECPNIFLFFCTLQMFCLLNLQMNACEPSPKTTSNDFNRWKSVTKIFCFHAISKDICLLF